MTRLFLLFLRAIAPLPQAVFIALGNVLGMLLYLRTKTRHITLTNLRLCFPTLSEAERVAMAKAHFRLMGRSFLERGILWWGSAERLRAMTRIEGLEHLQTLLAAGKPVVLFAYHCVGLDLAWSRLSMDVAMVGMYADNTTKDDLFAQAMYQGRGRFGRCEQIGNRDGMKACIRRMKAGLPFYYLPDMDFGRKNSIFVPFFGVPTATVPGLSRLATSTGAAIVPIEVILEGDVWVIRLEPAWENFPGDSAEADTRRMNAYLEEKILKAPEQYWWTHRRFRTRPEGESPVY